MVGRLVDRALVTKGGEVGLGAATYERLEAFVDGLPAGDIREIVRCFDDVRQVRSAA